MKLIIPLLLFCSSLFSQTIINLPDTSIIDQSFYGYSEPLKKEWKYKNVAWSVGLNIGNVVLNAMGDAYNDIGEKTLGHSLRAASIACILVKPLVIKMPVSGWGWDVVSNIGFRTGLFDPVYNLTRGFPYNYIGNSSLTDKFQQKQGFNTFARGVVLVVTVSMSLKNVNK